MSKNLSPLNPWTRPSEAGPSNASPYLDDFDDLGNGPSLLGRKIVSSPDSNAGSATHPISLGVSVGEVHDDAGTVKSEQDDGVETKDDALIVQFKKKRKPSVALLEVLEGHEQTSRSLRCSKVSLEEALLPSTS
ncbi:unnamed protein product [Arabis nemorensis]|uniref:Uncharacterized protein n=1 Tax=Arabis nemorensis TaxID=586526 RepID=A0A565BKS5_9BRAS|nr:unnamed protein product [Arabis nemorensis]